MGSKKFRNKLCVYCARETSVTGDHVFAREFFLPNRRCNLPQVPTCGPCNNAKSKIEHYLTALLPFGGRHTDALESLTTLVPKRLERNKKLQRHLATRRSTVWSLENGVYRQAMTVPLEPGSIEQLFALIAKGLAWHHWRLYFTEEHTLEAMALTSFGEKFLQQNFFDLNVAQRVQVSLGEGTVQYEAVQGVDCSHITVWRFKVYGGLAMGGDPEAPNEVCNQIAVLTAPNRTFRMAELLSKFGAIPKEKAADLFSSSQNK
ncbi:hypothetical protein SAMN04488038_10953 [Solimonas aquatica]|uniref:HNH endonuclease n=1 Tax=Solimonas aquatica TaxID=489703 RepID=A0A1H9HVR9_9GAMM|nr:HNH endonuclease [Solimonas aquatica]SEQ66439.1 hypothetical protein SAMN04488038_10953 [Solimonas aquatica]